MKNTIALLTSAADELRAVLNSSIEAGNAEDTYADLLSLLNDIDTHLADTPALPGPLQDTDPMPFGKHKGTLLIDVPASYLLWIWNDGMYQESTSSPLAHYIHRNLDALSQEHPDTIINQP